MGTFETDSGARVFLQESRVEDKVIEYLNRMENHPAFDPSEIRVMPDTHPEPRSETVIGFTMPLKGRVVPNIVGNDIGCGVSGICVGQENPFSEFELEDVDKRIRDRIPMGRGRDGYSSPNRTYYNIKDEFPWSRANAKLEEFVEQNNLWDTELGSFLREGGYDIQWFKEMCNRVHADMTQAINGVGTLGAGNHFIEIGRGEESDEIWLIVHSGSRALGKRVADYWQDKATELRNPERYTLISERIRQEFPDEYAEYARFDIDEVDDQELVEWYNGEVEGGVVDYEALKADFTGSKRERINEIGESIKHVVPHDRAPEDWFDVDLPSTKWDYLEGEEAHGYYRDMVFCQLYASENRRRMLFEIVDEFGIDVGTSDFLDSPHNIVDFKDSVIRKGATSAHEGERGIIPFNMSAGAVLVEGLGNDEWNKSVSHGAGRTGSRGEARDTISRDEAEESMDGIFASEIPLDEAPQAYKDTDMILDRIRETVEIIERIRPVINFKAPS